MTYDKHTHRRRGIAWCHRLSIQPLLTASSNLSILITSLLRSLLSLSHPSLQKLDRERKVPSGFWWDGGTTFGLQLGGWHSVGRYYIWRTDSTIHNHEAVVKERFDKGDTGFNLTVALVKTRFSTELFWGLNVRIPTKGCCVESTNWISRTQ